MNWILLCHFFRKSSAKSGLSRIAHPSRLYASGMAYKDRAQGPRVYFIYALRRVEALFLLLASIHRSALINRQTVVKRALKAALKA
ncbi:hypothetical protein WCX49_07850 [Sulfurimonas sp. HSL-1656]|uniref:hypothetical protein n=1 Tax=Thiomicrolovo subterrani TaxID=3131934 RepID=UPI0031F9BF03